MKQLLLSLFTAAFALTASAEDGHQLWLRYQPANKAKVVTTAQSPTIRLAQEQLETYYNGNQVTLQLDATMPDDDGYRISGTTITARRDVGLLYGAFALLLRLLNHWDNLDGSIERGYAGESIFEWFHLDEQLIKDYARANASIGINGSVLNNVNASPKMLTAPYLNEVKKIADILRPYGIKTYLSINFSTPMALKETKTADPLDKSVARWWQRKAKEIYKLIPDFGGFLVKANSEGQPGPGDYHRTHADGANMLADALRMASPKGGGSEHVALLRLWCQPQGRRPRQASRIRIQTTRWTVPPERHPADQERAPRLPAPRTLQPHLRPD